MSDVPWPAAPAFPVPPLTNDQALQVSAMAQQYIAQVEAFGTAKKYNPAPAPRPDADLVLDLAFTMLGAGHAPAGVVADAQSVLRQWRAAYPRTTPAPT